MDAEELIKHDRDTKQWLADIESFRRPPPVKKLTDEVGSEKRDVVGRDLNAKNEQEDFVAKLRKFQLSDAHPYSGNERVQACKRLAASAKLGDMGMLSLATECKRREKISKQQATALREEITRLTRPTNPYSSPRSDSDSYGRGSSLSTFTEPDDESTSGRTSSDHAKYTNGCFHDEYSKEYGAKCRPVHSDVHSEFRVDSNRYAAPAATPTAEESRLSSDGDQTTMADKEVSRIMGIANDSSYDPSLASRNSRSAANAPCSRGTQRHLRYMQDGLEDGWQQRVPGQPPVTVSSEHVVSLSKSRVALQSPNPNKAHASVGVGFADTSPLLGKDALRNQQKKCWAMEREVEQEMSKNNTVYGNCAVCDSEVTRLTDAVHACGYLFHPECFICCCCGRSLRGKTFYESNLRFYCKEDYMYSGFQEFAEKCHSCGHLILEMLLQAGGKSFHPQCFRCCKCKACLDGVPFTVDNQGQFFCVRDYHTLFAPKCAKCHEPITPVPGAEETVRVVAMQRDYHVDCYVCEGCGVQLTDEPDKRCYPLEEHLLCQSCNLCWTLTGGTANPITDV
uniref:LIM zinc-binding domain-containing protein n=1 Tax=Trichuris muris TaxID=70415 RepID=A0A5S6QCW8_TRIMR